MISFVVTGGDVTRAWIAACNALDRKDNPSRTGLHTVVRIADPTADDPGFRTELDRLRIAKRHEPIETVAGTLFPADLAARATDHTSLVARYRAMYPRIKRYPGNAHGTYFGRLVAYPGAKKTDIDQIGNIIGRLRKQTGSKGPMTAAYEADLAHPDDGDVPAELLVHAADRDNLYRGFPCLSHVSFQLDRDRRVHAAALYRSQYMFERAYGNYLGLGRLLAYIAAQADLAVGTLTVVAGHAHLDGPLTALRPLLSGTPTLAA
ncbi:thymidylate synthase [Streptomyces sp. NPDC002766]|uniref:thymidylate synthase n=1 Tax=unclassified Streptomyces TaxID=2593676 RepID=UPI0033188A89